MPDLRIVAPELGIDVLELRIVAPELGIDVLELRIVAPELRVDAPVSGGGVPRSRKGRNLRF